ncbi:hypothetical protein ARTHRO_11935 [Limnospira indica PCC 8005]|uniref:Uncharacterized protein n=1 Tax=Limnospira indica PCC 8005 TaxID=376219 RepID=A0A9P1NY08_9CYAN|nr:hypothetical protein ARTHRO_11935 [Limnospira indica PCC 8005]
MSIHINRSQACVLRPVLGKYADTPIHINRSQACVLRPVLGKYADTPYSQKP